MNQTSVHSIWIRRVWIGITLSCLFGNISFFFFYFQFHFSKKRKKHQLLFHSSLDVSRLIDRCPNMSQNMNNAFRSDRGHCCHISASQFLRFLFADDVPTHLSLFFCLSLSLYNTANTFLESIIMLMTMLLLLPLLFVIIAWGWHQCVIVRTTDRHDDDDRRPEKNYMAPSTINIIIPEDDNNNRV